MSTSKQFTPFTRKHTSWRKHGYSRDGSTPRKITLVIVLAIGICVALILPPPENPPEPPLSSSLPTPNRSLTDTSSLFRAHYTIGENRLVQVLEEIEVRFTSEEPRHGILRFLPLSKITGENQNHLEILNLHATHATAQTPTRWKEAEPFDVILERTSEFQHIRLGREDTLLTPGRHRFVLSYDIAGSLTANEVTQEFSWMPIALWSASLPLVSLTITLPPKVEHAAVFSTLSVQSNEDTHQSRLILGENEVTTSRGSTQIMRGEVLEEALTVTHTLRKPLSAQSLVYLEMKWPAEYTFPKAVLRSARVF